MFREKCVGGANGTGFRYTSDEEVVQSKEDDKDSDGENTCVQVKEPFADDQDNHSS